MLDVNSKGAGGDDDNVVEDVNNHQGKDVEIYLLFKHISKNKDLSNI